MSRVRGGRGVAGSVGGWVRSGSEAGQVTVVMAGLAGALVVVLLAALSLGAAVFASHRARSAADLGALAGAAELEAGGGPVVACDRAATVVARNGAAMTSCQVDADDAVWVQATVPVGLIARSVGASVGAPMSAQARSRAGPGP